ncbi:MAG: response regulator [Elainella sp.]
MQKLQFLLLEDSVLDAELIRAVLQEGAVEQTEWTFDFWHVQSEADFVHALQTQPPDLILSDYSLPAFDGMAALALAQQLQPQVPFIFVSATLGEELAIETLKNGATDYVLKQRLERLVPAVQRALREARERTERQRAETALREAEDQYRLLFEQSPFGVLLIRTTDRSFVEFNTQAHQQLGYSREEFAQLRLDQIEVPAFADQIHTHMQTVLQAGFDQFETQHRTKSGEMRNVLVTAQLLHISGEPCLHSIWQDITERKQAEQAIRERSERLKILYETTSELLSTDQPITLLDDVFHRLSRHINLDCYFNFLVEPDGRTNQLFLTACSGITPAQVKALQEMPASETLCGLAVAQNQPIVINRVQTSNHPRADQIRSFGITAFVSYPLLARERLLGALSFGSRSRSQFSSEELDLLKATAEQVAVALERTSLLTSLQQQAEKLIQANQIKDEFLAVLSHELRTPLNPILGWARLLRTRSYDAPTTARALEIIERNAKIQTQLIEDLLDVSRILQGKLSLTIAPVDLNATVTAALETVRLAAEAKGITVRLAAPVDGTGPQGMVVLGDVNRLQQMIWNLLSNAVKFTGEGGEVRVDLEQTSGPVAIATTSPMSYAPPSSDYVQIRVTDTGKGIRPDFLPYVFDYFRQADGSTTRAFGGLGLGLAIVRHLVELHGGTIEASSPGENQGSTFVITLPLFRGQLPDSTPAAAADSELLTGIKILVVDDEQDALDFLTFLLEQSGAVVLPTLSAAAALAALPQFQPDILISDIGMPHQDGYMLLQQIRQFPLDQSGRIPAIALTAYARQEDGQRALQAGFQKHLAKPVEPIQLITAVTELIQS